MEILWPAMKLLSVLTAAGAVVAVIGYLTAQPGE